MTQARTLRALAVGLLALSGLSPLWAQEFLAKPGQLVLAARWIDPSGYAKSFGQGWFQGGGEAERWHYSESTRSVAPGQAQHPNLKSAALRVRAWSSPDGFFFATREFVWELNDELLQGSSPGKRISLAALAKYPSLMQRVRQLRPRQVNAVITARLRNQACIAQDPTQCVAGTLYFLVQHKHLVVPESRSLDTHAPPSVPPDWREVVSMDPDPRTRFSDKDRSSVEEMKRILLNAEALGRAGNERERLVDLKIEWPLEKIDEIIELYQRYEKEGKKLDEDFAALRPDFKPPALPAAYARGGELATPYEEEIKSAEAFSDPKLGVGLRAKGKVVMQSRQHYGPRKLDPEGRYWVFSISGSSDSQIFDARGKLVSVAGLDRFRQVSPGPQAGTYRLSVFDERGSPALVTQKDYPFGRASVLTDEEFRAFAAADGDGRCVQRAGGKPGTLSFSTTERINLYRGRLLTLDGRLQLLSDKPGFFAHGRPPSQVGRSICEGR